MSRDLPPTRRGGPASRALRVLALTLATTAVFGGLCQPTIARADDETERNAVNAQLAQASQDLDEQNAALDAAVKKAQDTHAALANAQSALAQAQADRAQAQAADKAAADALTAAQAALAKAKADVKQGEENLAAERKRAGNIAMGTFRSQGQLASWAAMVSAKSTSALADRAQWNNEMMAAHNRAMDDLNRAQRAFEDNQAAQTKAEAASETARQDAARALSSRQQAESNASAAAAGLTTAAKADDAAQSDAQKAVTDEKARIAGLEDQRAAVEKRIQERMAREAAEAKARAEAEAKAQADAAAAAAAAAAQQGGSGSAPAATAAASGQNGLFAWPVDGALTSGFGMRLHPVLHIWVLHDGQDIAAECGTPIKAAAAGTVVERYWDTTGFGNRLLVDHGIVNGTAYTTGYNHAESWIVNVGDHVDKGQVLGYVGSTGYSTGCHLHLNIYVNGKVVDPLPYL